MKRLALAAALVLTVTSLAAAETKTKKVLYVGIDGARFDAIEAAKTPSLHGLIDNGIHADNCLILGDRYQKNDTISGPGWSSILIGTWADKHGVNDNTFKGKNYGEYPHFFVRLREQKPDARLVSLVTWAPIEDFIVTSADVHLKWEDKTKDYAKFDAAAAEEAVKQLAEPTLDCMFLYFGQIDETGHKHGFHPTVPQYVAAIQRVDAHLGIVLAALEKRATRKDEDWLIVVTSDHGGKGTGHSNGHKVPEILNSFLIVSGASAERGKFSEQTYLVDAPVTVLTHLGVTIKDEWKLDGVARGLKKSE
jgi:predicted AlkP superfamily pyrophosphatase or phosphodiesterase